MSVSFWLPAPSAVPARAPLAADGDADVCIVGAGFTGLWTAYALLRAEPALRVVLLEAEHVGFGASGRNGGWLSGEFSGGRSRWATRPGGRAGAVALERAIHATVDDAAADIAEAGIACDLVKGGALHVARSTVELARVEEEVADDRAWGFGPEDAALLGTAETRARVAVDGVRGARFTPHAARLHPGKLVLGLADAVERAGARIHERTRVTTIAERRVTTTGGLAVSADWVVRATEAYSVHLAPWQRALVPVNSAMLVTEPLGDDRWAELGWAGQELLLDGRNLYAYLQRTADGRIAIGGRGVPYRFGSRTDREGPVPPGTVAALRGRLRDLFPPTADIPVARAWHGVLGVSRDWAPAVGVDAAAGLAWAGGYAGEGVAAAHLAGRTLADLMLGLETPRTHLPWVGPEARDWEREPLRFLGVRAVHGLMAGADAREARTGRASRLASAAGWLSGR